MLLIEDSPTEAMLIRSHLARRTNPSFALYHETTLRAGIERLRQSAIDIVVLDLTLPDSKGLQTFLSLSAAAGDLPIAILSGVKDDWIAVEAVRHGAQDFFHKDEMVSESLGRLLQYTIERFYRQEAEREIATAGIVQSRLFPKRPPVVPGFDIAGRCDPANHVGGDYFDYFMSDDQHLLLVIGDVAGHGLGPSLVMAETRAALRTAAAGTDDVGKMIRQANDLLCCDAAGTFVTLFLGRIDTLTGALSYVSAGHPAELRCHDGSFHVLSSKQPPLGVEANTQFEVHRTELRIGDTLFLYTDGISERRSEAGDQFSAARVRESVAASESLTACQAIDRLFEQANAFANQCPAVDDMTAIIVKVLHRLLAPWLLPPRSPE